MIELNWKLFVLSFGVIDPASPGRGGGGGGRDTSFRPFLFHYPKMAQAIKRTFSDFEDTLIRHI